MSAHFILIVFWALVVSTIHNEIQHCSGCFLKEKRALLDFKASLNETQNAHLLPSWTDKEDDGTNTDCCSWERVKCSNITGRIVELQLGQLIGFEDGYLNISNFVPLKDLRALDLSSNSFHGEVTGVCSLKNLHELYLTENNFNGSIPPCFSNLTSLRVLDLSDNALSGNIPAALITPLVHLEYLSLSGNLFGGSFSLSSLANHSKLQVLKLAPLTSDLHVNTEDLTLPPPFQLKVLDLSGCNLNNRTHRIPSFLFYQKEVVYLYLSSNMLVGEIPSWLIANNTNLEILDIKNNSFTGPFLFDDSLEVNLDQLDISNNEVNGKVPQHIGLSFPHLRYLNLSVNSFEASIPQSLGNLTRAIAIDLSYNKFSGEVPDQIGAGCLSLKNLILSYNNLHGYFPFGLMNLTSLYYLYLDNNHFIGNISHGLPRSPSLSILDISNNAFQGNIPSWIGSLSALMILDMSVNSLEGSLPDAVCKLEKLEFLDLSENQLIGPLPACSQLKSLKFIHLNHNKISGFKSNMLSGSFNLMTLDLRYNKLSSGIPRYIGELKELRVLLMGGNELQGHIPLHLCQLQNLTIMDLSQNKFSGPLPSCFSNISFGKGATDAFAEKAIKYAESSVVVYANPGSSKLYNSSSTVYGVGATNEISFSVSSEQEEVEFRTKTRTERYGVRILNFMSGLDLSCNQLIGEIPPEFGDLSHLRALNLSHNYLQGSIPSRLSMLKVIESLDLSYNDFSGEIPSELASLNFLSMFNVSYNNLSGRTPDKGQFANFDENNYRGNPGLCGPLLKRSCNGTIEQLPGSVGDEDKEVDGVIDVVAFAWSFFASYMVVVISLVIILCVSPYYKRAWSFYIDYWILSRFYEYCRSRSFKKRQTWKVFDWNMKKR